MNTYLCFVFVGAGKSSKSASRFSVSDLEAFTSLKSIKKELATNPSILNPKGMSTRGKGAKKRKPLNPLNASLSSNTSLKNMSPR
ncbi:hypothetical protein Hanom_Chr13g01219731 [Helianthus anomalus]